MDLHPSLFSHVEVIRVKYVFFLSLIVCMALVGAASAAVPADNLTANVTGTANVTANATATAAPALIGGDMGTYLVKANVDGANVTFDSDFKGVTKDGKLAVSVYTTGTPYKVITVEKSGYAVYTANITSVPAKNETVDLAVTLVPLAASNSTAANATVTTEVTTASAPVTTAAESPAPTKSGSLPFVVFGAFAIVGILAIRSRR